MKHFLKRILLFSTPFILCTLVAFYIDPYNIFKEEQNLRLKDLKFQIAGKLSPPLYKLKKYSDNPTDVVLLGDSRTNRLNVKVFDSLTNMKTTNLAYNGGTFPEIIETFWHITEVHKIKKLFIGISFNLSSEKNGMNRVNQAIKLKKSTLSYLTSRYCLKSTFLIIKSLLTNKMIDIEKPKLDKAEFWKYQLETTATNLYRDYEYPRNHFISLSKIADYCLKNNIELIFFVPPTHVDLQEKVNEFSLNESEKRFKSDLSKLGKLYDFDYPNSLTQNRENFGDPFHYNDSIANLVASEIASGAIVHARN